MLDQCNQLLRALLGNDLMIHLWWITQNRAFHFKTPSEVFAVDPDKVYDYLYGMLNSDYS